MQKVILVRLCEICGASFTKKGSLKQHILRHVGVTQKCVVCRRGFSDKASLEEHLQYHTGFKWHKCSECGNCFSTSWCLKMHAKELRISNRGGYSGNFFVWGILNKIKLNSVFFTVVIYITNQCLLVQLQSLKTAHKNVMLWLSLFIHVSSM